MPISNYPCDADPESTLAIRIFYSYFIDPKTLDWKSFTMRAGFFTLNSTLRVILSDIDADSETASRHLIVCIDETLLAVSEQPRSFIGLMTAIGAVLEAYPRVHMVLSSLSIELMTQGATNSGRAVVRLPMYPLSLESVEHLYDRCWNKQTMDQKTRFTNHQFMLDAAGSPRLLSFSSKLVTGNYQTLEKLRGRLESAEPLLKLTGKPEIPELRNSLIQALRGDLVMPERCEGGIQRGFLLMQLKGPVWMIPVIAPSIICCLEHIFRNDGGPIDPIAKRLLCMSSEFLSYDFHQKEYHGVFFEKQFQLLLRIRCLALCSPMQERETTQEEMNIIDKGLCTVSNKMPMRELISGGMGTPPSVLIGSLFNKDLQVPALLETAETDTPVLRAGTLWSPKSKTFAGIDGLLTLTDDKGSPVVFGLQYKWSATSEDGNSVTSLSCNAIAEAIVKTCKYHHGMLSPFIREGRFGFIVAAYRTISCPSDGDYETVLKQHINTQADRIWPGAGIELKELIDLVANNICILGKKDMQRILTPTLERRPPFHLDASLS